MSSKTSKVCASFLALFYLVVALGSENESQNHAELPLTREQATELVEEIFDVSSSIPAGFGLSSLRPLANALTIEARDLTSPTHSSVVLLVAHRLHRSRMDKDLILLLSSRLGHVAAKHKIREFALSELAQTLSRIPIEVRWFIPEGTYELHSAYDVRIRARQLIPAVFFYTWLHSGEEDSLSRRTLVSSLLPEDRALEFMHFLGFKDRYWLPRAIRPGYVTRVDSGNAHHHLRYKTHYHGMRFFRGTGASSASPELAEVSGSLIQNAVELAAAPLRVHQLLQMLDPTFGLHLSPRWEGLLNQFENPEKSVKEDEYWLMNDIVEECLVRRRPSATTAASVLAAAEVSGWSDLSQILRSQLSSGNSDPWQTPPQNLLKPEEQGLQNAFRLCINRIFRLGHRFLEHQDLRERRRR